MNLAYRLLTVGALWVGLASISAAQQNYVAAPVYSVAVAEEESDDLAGLRAELAALHRRIDEMTMVASQGCGCESGCGAMSGCDCEGGCACDACAGCEECETGGVYAGAALFLVRPYMKEAFQAFVVDGVTDTMTLVPFDFQYDPSIRVWAGMQTKSGLGFRGRWWYYDEGGAPYTATSTATTFPGSSASTTIYTATILTGAPGEVLTVTNSLQAITVDFDATVEVKTKRLELLAGAGVRYASMEQKYLAQIDGGTSSIDWERDFYGFGPSLSGDLRIPMGKGGFAGIGSARCSLLFGDKTLRRSVVGDTTPGSPPANVQLIESDEVTGIFEFNVGAEWSHEFERIGLVKLQGIYESQLWTDAGFPVLTFLGFEGFSFNLTLMR